MHKKAAAGAAVLALLAAGCGASGQSGGSGGSSSGTVSITVGYVPYVDAVALFSAKEKGIFAKHGLDVKLTPAQAPTAIVAAMLSGQEQFGFVTTPVLVNANAKGTPVKCVSTVDGNQTADTAKDSTALVAAKDSGIRTVADLAGKKVGVVQLASLNAIDVQALAVRAGIDPADVTLVQLPFPQIPTALRQGRVDAGVIVSPFAETALKDGGHTVVHPNVELWPGGTVTCLAATTRYLSANADVAGRFRDAINEATLFVKDNLDEAKATLVKYMDMTPEQAARQSPSDDFDPKLNLDSIGRIQDTMKELKLVDRTVPVSDMVWEGAAR